MNYEKQCRICGKDIVVPNSRYCTCGSDECKKKNNRLLHEEYYKRIKNDSYLYEEMRKRDLDNLRRSYKPVMCRLCGKQMVRDYNAPTHRDRMHTECIIKDTIETLNRGTRLTPTQRSRLCSRGYDLGMVKEMIKTGEIY